MHIVTNYYPNYISHHGIKGQKWGIRRYQNEDGTYTAEGKERRQMSLASAYNDYDKEVKKLRFKSQALSGTVGTVGTVGAAVAGAVVGAPVVMSAATGALMATPITTAITKTYNKKYENLIKQTSPVKVNEIVLKEGDELIRTSTSSSEKSGERLYTAYSKDTFSKEYYGNVWPEKLRQISGDPNLTVYRNTYKVKTDIVAPSLERRKEAVASVLSSNNKLREELGKEYALSQLKLATGNLKAKSIKELKSSLNSENQKSVDDFVDSCKKYSANLKVDSGTVDDDTFRTFNSVIPTSSKLMDAYIGNLKKDGFNAVFDDNANAPAPFIIFDQKAVEQTKSEKLR